MSETVAIFCDCLGPHKPECVLGRRLKIKYDPMIMKIWDMKGPEFTEKLIDEILERA